MQFGVILEISICLSTVGCLCLRNLLFAGTDASIKKFLLVLASKSHKDVLKHCYSSLSLYWPHSSSSPSTSIRMCYRTAVIKKVFLYFHLLLYENEVDTSW